MYKNIGSAIGKLTDSERLWEIASMKSLHFTLRIEALKNPNLADINKLIDVAKNNSHKNLRLAAASNPNLLAYPDILADIAKNDSYFYVRAEVCNYIEDDNVLADIVRNDSDARVRHSAYKNISNDDILEDIAYSTCDGDIQEIAATKINDPKCLMYLAENGIYSTARDSAFLRILEKFPHLIMLPSEVMDITDEDRLLDILENEWYYESRLKACSMIKNENVLMDIIIDYYNRERDGYISNINRFYDDMIKTAFKNINCEEFLIKSARTGINFIYSEAIDKLKAINPELETSCDDENAPEYIAKNAIDYLCRLFALDDIDDEDVLGDIVKSDLCIDVRERCLEKITDEKTLEYVVNNDLNLSIRKKAIEKIKDEEILTNIIHTFSEDDIIYIAIKNINDEDILFALAENSGNSDYVRIWAVQSIFNQQILKHIAINFSEPWLIQHALDNINDVKFKFEIAGQYPSVDVRVLDFAKVEDEGDIADAIWDSSNGNIGEAMRYINDEHVLQNLALNSPSYEVRSRALSKLKNGANLPFLKPDHSNAFPEKDQFFLKIALNDSSYYVRDQAMKGIRDKSILTDLALNNESYKVRKMAISHIYDISCLFEIYKNDVNDDLRYAAVENLNFIDSKIFVDIAKNDKYLPIVLLALEKIEDFTIVEEICLSSGDELLIAFSKDIEEMSNPTLGEIPF